MEKTAFELKKRIEELEKELDILRLKNQHAEEAYDNLLHAFKEFQRNRFGSKSERFIDITPALKSFD
jgi:transposase